MKQKKQITKKQNIYKQQQMIFGNSNIKHYYY